MKYIVPDLLDAIKAKYEDALDKPISVYRLVLQSGADGFNLCFPDVEHVLEYDDLCARMFDLDVSGWEVINVKDSSENFPSPDNMYDTVGFILVTITLFRKI